MKNKTTLMLLLTALCSSNAFAKITFPYAGFKEVEFSNPYLTQEFESFISDMHKQDLAFQKELDAANDKFLKKYEKERRMSAYKEEPERLERLGRVAIKEEKNFNKLTTQYITNEVKLFNDFVKSIQGNPKLSKTEQIAFIKAVKPLHTAYQDVFESFSIDIKNTKIICFVDYDKAMAVADECNYMYDTIEDRIEGSKYHIASFMNKFVTKYKVETTGSDFRENLKGRIDEIKRMNSFKWE